MTERNVDIVIRAKDEFSGPITKAQRSVETALEKMNRSFESLSGLKKAMKALEDDMRSSVEASAPLNGGPSGDGSRHVAALSRQRTYNRLALEEETRFALERGALEEGNARRTDEIERASWDMRLKYAEFASSTLSNMMQNLYVATGSRHRAMFEAMKAFAIAETVIQTYRAAQGAYAALAPIPIVGPALAATAAAAAVAAGLARIEVIRNTKPGGATSTISAVGRANPSYSGGSTNAYPVPTRLEEDTRAPQHITIQIYNPLSEQNWQKITEENIVPALRSAADRNVNVVFRQA